MKSLFGLFLFTIHIGLLIYEAIVTIFWQSACYVISSSVLFQFDF